jgi:hypothetical protein
VAASHELTKADVSAGGLGRLVYLFPLREASKR